MYRLPAAFTMIEPGRLRSARQNHGPLGSGMVGPHQASSIRSISAPAAIPARMPPPWLEGAPVVQAAVGGAGRALPAHSRVLRDPAAAEDDSLGRPDLRRDAVLEPLHPDDAAVL